MSQNQKGDLLRSYLEERGVRLRPRLGEQQISCINAASHPRGDRKPSASVNLTKGLYHCFSCGLSGDAYTLLMMEKDIDFKTARATLGGVASESPQETWL